VRAVFSSINTPLGLANLDLSLRFYFYYPDLRPFITLCTPMMNGLSEFHRGSNLLCKPFPGESNDRTIRTHRRSLHGGCCISETFPERVRTTIRAVARAQRAARNRARRGRT